MPLKGNAVFFGHPRHIRPIDPFKAEVDRRWRTRGQFRHRASDHGYADRQGGRFSRGDMQHECNGNYQGLGA